MKDSLYAGIITLTIAGILGLSSVIAEEIVYKENNNCVANKILCNCEVENEK